MKCTSWLYTTFRRFMELENWGEDREVEGELEEELEDEDEEEEEKEELFCLCLELEEEEDDDDCPKCILSIFARSSL